MTTLENSFPPNESLSFELFVALMVRKKWGKGSSPAEAVRRDGAAPVSKERAMKRFVLLHYGFEKPTPEIMAAWGKWFESIKDKTIDNLGFGGGREIRKLEQRTCPSDVTPSPASRSCAQRALMKRRRWPSSARTSRASGSTN